MGGYKVFASFQGSSKVSSQLQSALWAQLQPPLQVHHRSAYPSVQSHFSPPFQVIPIRPPIHKSFVFESDSWEPNLPHIPSGIFNKGQRPKRVIVECHVLASRGSGIEGELGKVVLAQSQNFLFIFWIVTSWSMYWEGPWGKISAWGRKYPTISQLLCTLDKRWAEKEHMPSNYSSSNNYSIDSILKIHNFVSSLCFLLLR